MKYDDFKKEDDNLNLKIKSGQKLKNTSSAQLLLLVSPTEPGVPFGQDIQIFSNWKFSQLAQQNKSAPIYWMKMVQFQMSSYQID